MKAASFVLASQRVPAKQTGKQVFGTWGGAEDEYEREWVLAKASDVGRLILYQSVRHILTLQVAIVDSITMLQYFGRHVLAAPEVRTTE
jgi:hypothetical protein